MANLKVKKVLSKYTVYSNADFPSGELLVSAHGSKDEKNAHFVVPSGMSVCFHCPDRHVLKSVGVSMLKFADVHPYEVYEAGSVCPDYELGFYENNTLDNITKAIGRFKKLMDWKQQVVQYRADRQSGVSSVYNENETYAIDNMDAIENAQDSRPIDILTVDELEQKWFSFFSSPAPARLSDIVRWAGTLGAFDGYGIIQCCICRSLPGDPVYHGDLNNKFENIWYVTKNKGRIQKNK